MKKKFLDYLRSPVHNAKLEIIESEMKNGEILLANYFEITTRLTPEIPFSFSILIK